MRKIRTTFSIDEEVIKILRVTAGRTRKRESQIVEEALRTALDFHLFDEIWLGNDFPEDKALQIALEVQAYDWTDD